MNYPELFEILKSILNKENDVFLGKFNYFNTDYILEFSENEENNNTIMNGFCIPENENPTNL